MLILVNQKATKEKNRKDRGKNKDTISRGRKETAKGVCAHPSKSVINHKDKNRKTKKNVDILSWENLT